MTTNFELDDCIIDTIELLESNDDVQHIAPSDDADAADLYNNDRN